MSSLKSIPKSVNTCPKHSKTMPGQISNHAPTIKCHEEVMSRLSSCTNEDRAGGPNNFSEQFYDHRNEKSKDIKPKTVTSKCKLGLHQSVSVPIARRLSGQRHKNVYPKTVKSKSIPDVPSSTPEDCIDFIPVKLTSTNTRKQRPQKRVRHNLESRLEQKEKTTKHNRPTWDEILRNNLEVISKPEKNPRKKSVESVKTNCCQSESSSPTTLNKEPLKKPDNFHDKCDTRTVSMKQPSECSVSNESLISEKIPILQQVSSSDPIKTLDFLIRQLRDGVLRQPQNNSLQNIILDMENALQKISVGSKSCKNNPPESDLCEKERSGTSLLPSTESTSSQEKIRSNRQLDIMQLEQNLEKSCRYLQSLCIKQKENCNNHLREKEQISLQLAESRRLLALSKSKEKDYEVTVGELRLKLQEANTSIDQLKQSLQDLENKNSTLKDENKTMISLKQSLKRAGVRLKQIASEKEILQSKLSLKDLEIEKLKVLLQVKTNQKTDLQQDNLLNLSPENAKSGKQNENNLSVISLSTVTSWSDGAGLICSSQASSTPRRSPSPYNSWQHISSIMQQPSAAADLNRDIALILQDLKKKSEQLEPLQLELQNPSSCSSLWSDRDKVVYSDGESEGFSS